ncbi:YopX family protein [Brevibacillus laterosporus]|uniref:YopX family protein n=1 Tax=Brevibacillus laterosporus TaxID=1465 RepID=UPI003D1CA19D
MREIKFRGKAFNVNGIECLPKWVYGNLIISDNGDCFITKWIRSSGVGYESVTYQVDPKSVGQYTGLKDKNGKEIYKGDIIKRNFEIGRVVINPISLGAEDYEIDDSGYFIGVVSYRPSEGYVLNKCKKFNDDDELQSKKSGVKIYPNHAEVIGNIYENPELLEEAQ